MKRLWLVRLGKNGEGETSALETSNLVLGFTIDSLAGAKDREAVLAVVARSLPDLKPKTQLNFAAQLNQFCNQMQLGDLVVVPLKTTGQIAVGEVAGPYAHTAQRAVSRPVNWLRQDMPREAFRQDLLFSFGAFMTVCEVRRNDALRRVEVTVKTGVDPGFETGVELPKRPTANPEIAVEDATDAERDLAQLARDQIERKIASSFTGHEFTRLVAEILKAQGYVVNVSPPGADNGIDMVAGRGTLGFDAPTLVVQVKSGEVVVDQPTLQALIGAVTDAKASHGLLVSWRGFNRVVEKRRNELFFRIRMWGRTQLVDALLETYERLPEEFRAELALRRIWTLVPDEGAEAP
jgi:restriction system protein